MNKKIGAVLLAIPLSSAALAPLKTEASAGSVYWEGADNCDVIVREKTAMELEKESLLLTVSDFPDPSSPVTYLSFVRAEYTFYNPTDSARQLLLYLPMEQSCSYFSTLTANENGGGLYRVQANGGDVAYALRHTYQQTGQFEAEKDAARIADEKREDEFYTEELPVTAQTFSFRSEAEGETYYRLLLRYNSARTRVLLSDFAAAEPENGALGLCFTSEAAEGEFTIYSIGAPAEVLEISVSSDPKDTMSEEGASFLPFGESTETFAAFAEALRPSFISEHDWYNGLIDVFNHKCDEYGVLHIPKFLLNGLLFRSWCEYSIEIGAHERFVNTVTAPLLPTFSEKGPIYRYEYQLSPSRRWENFHELEIEIKTPFYLAGSSLAFEKTEEGYLCSRTSLPIDDLSFTLARSEEDYLAANAAAGEGLSPSTRLAVILLSVLGGGALLGLGAFLILRKKRR